MPPLIEDDSDGSASEEEIQPRAMKAETQKEESEVEENGEEGSDEEAEIYVVEKILTHDTTYLDGEVWYEIKWLGYDQPQDLTWEKESNLTGASELLQTYWNSIGGRPVADVATKSKKRGRQSLPKTDTPYKAPKKQKTEAAATASEKGASKWGRKKKEKSDDASDRDMTFADDWSPPDPTPGSWEKDVIEIETIEGSDGPEKYAYLVWAAKDENDKWRQTKARLSTVYIACPQRMLKFYESHLVFTDRKDDQTNGHS